jgi:hypothetical protein
LLNPNPPDEDIATVRDGQDERAVRSLHRARALRGLTPEQVGRIASMLDETVGRAPRRRLVPVLAAVALLLSAGSALAWATGTLERLPLLRALLTSHGRVGPASGSGAPQATGRRSAASSEVLAASEPPTPVPLEPHRVDTQAELRPHGRREKMASSIRSSTPTGASPSATPSTADSPIAREGASFADVLRRWHQSHDARAALAALDVHDRGFASGQLRLESRVLRVELLLAAGREREALVILDSLPLGGVNMPRGRELLTVRGELRIQAGRCADGAADLASIRGGSDALAERARNALTHCR